MKDRIKIAAVQMESRLMAPKENLDKVLLGLRTAAGGGADLVVFPECALTGYVFESRAEALPYGETIPGYSTKELATCCRDLGVHAVVGLIETDGDRVFNAAVLIGPEGLVGRYRKNHLPFLGLDRFVDPGDGPFRVYGTPIGNIGLHICYDCSFPESARVMMLLGADVLVLPTNWPEGRTPVAEHVTVARAYENRVHLVAANRVGRERGTKFIGLSCIVNARGDTVARAGGDNEGIIYGDVALADARQKHIVFKPGEIEIDILRDRRPGLYRRIVEG